MDWTSQQPLEELFGISPDDDQLKRWQQSLADMAAVLQPIIATRLQTPSEFARTCALSEAVERAQQVLA